MRGVAALKIYSDSEELMRAAAERVVAHAAASIDQRGRFSVALSGGSTPRRLYELLAAPAIAARISWPHVHVFWGDERCVPPAHPASNYRMADEALLAHVPLPAANVHRIAGEDDPEAAARAYEVTLRAAFPPERSFDLVLLGLGEDGHTASLFPGQPPLVERHRWVMATHATQIEPPWRITLTPVVLDAAATILFLVAGAAKAERLAEVLEGAGQALPAWHIRPTHGMLAWMADAAAASRLRRTA
jgi:6-phosphogluconolactonase